MLLDGGKEIARGEADARGEWVMLLQDPPLAPGQHELRAVHHIEGRAPVTSEQVVVAVVPAPAGASVPRHNPRPRKEETMVLIVAVVGRGDPDAAALARRACRRSADLQISTMDYDQRGQTTITGQATPGTTVRAYLDDKVVAEGKAGPDGRWRLAPAEPVEPGPAHARLDRLAQDGKPIARLEMKFDAPRRRRVAGDSPPAARRARRQSLEHRPRALWRGLALHHDLRGQQGPDPRSRI